MTAPIRLGMVGGGEGAFIGGVHRMVARLDGAFTLVAGAFSSDAEKSKRSGAALGLAADRCYGDYEAMAQAEAARADGIQAVSIVTPNHMHLPVARAFMKAGIHVICDKPLTTDLASAQAFAAERGAEDPLFVLTHNYTGAPMVRQAQAMVADGVIGQLRLVQAEYVQDWLTEPPEADNKQAAWRTDPNQSGKGGAIGDIGTHAYHLACFVSGQRAESLCADLTAFVPGRAVDDNAAILLRYANGAKGMLWASQVAPGNENALSLRVYGDKGGLEWRQEDPNVLWFTPFGAPKQKITRGGAGAGTAATAVTRVPAGHPEGYLESFATIYSEAASAIRAHDAGQAPDASLRVTTLADGVHGMQFIDACLASSGAGAVWTKLDR